MRKSIILEVSHNASMTGVSMSKLDGKSLAFIEFLTLPAGEKGRKILDEAGLATKLDVMSDTVDKEINSLINQANQRVDEKQRTPRT